MALSVIINIFVVQNIDVRKQLYLNVILFHIDIQCFAWGVYLLGENQTIKNYVRIFPNVLHLYYYSPF